MEQFDDLPAGAGVKLDDATLDRIDEIVPPALDIAPLEHSAYVPPAIKLDSTITKHSEPIAMAKVLHRTLREFILISQRHGAANT